MSIYSGFVTYLLGLLLAYALDSVDLGGLVVDDLEDFANSSFSYLGFEFVVAGTLVLGWLGQAS